ncbi:hypothetical protein [Kitasatospora sp. MBT63]|uniref:hypothetical protein n=1 Tax=Kitasatospora sp. MBT63 TaxID=1444768 RepID=UPI000539AD79|nr:hypothetical protein [Kitasatospora sp. MBT63]
MSYATPYPPAGPPYGAPRPQPPGGRDGSLIALALLLLVQLAIEVGVLVWDFGQAGPDYLGTALGFSFDAYVQAPVGFFGYDTALCVALVVLAVGAFSGGRWTRPAAVSLLGVNAYAAGAQLINQGGDGFAEPVSHLVLNLTVVASLLLALAVAVLVGVTQRRSPERPAVQHAPYPGAQPYQVPQPYQHPQAPQPPQVPQGYLPYPGQPPVPADAPPAAPAAPPAPPTAPPGVQ